MDGPADAARHRFSDLGRPPLRPPGPGGELRLPGSWWHVRVVDQTVSTNADLVAQVRSGAAAAGDVLVAEWQSGGRGRADRSWLSPPRAGLLMSVAVATEPSPWVPLLAGVVVARTVRGLCGLDAELKWPNDVLLAGAKLGGLLCEVAGPRVVVVGLGLNVTTRADELPPDVAATSLALAGAGVTDRRSVLLGLLQGFEGFALLGPQDYTPLCATLGREVVVHLPSGEQVAGVAERLDEQGRLVVAGRAFSAGDVRHVRPA